LKLTFLDPNYVLFPIFFILKVRIRGKIQGLIDITKLISYTRTRSAHLKYLRDINIYGIRTKQILDIYIIHHCESYFTRLIVSIIYLYPANGILCECTLDREVTDLLVYKHGGLSRVTLY